MSEQRSWRSRRLIVAIGFVVLGTFGSCGAVMLAVPAWRAAHQGGRVGTFTLTEAGQCDRYPPPRQRCGWFGDFVSDDGEVVKRHRELAGGLPPGAKVGDTVPARDTGSFTEIYQLSDRNAWHQDFGFVAAFISMTIAGILLLKPWSWWRWLRERRRPASELDRISEDT